MKKHIVLIVTKYQKQTINPWLITMFLLLPTLAFSHLCNDVYRQSNKWIIEPEVSNIIVKDTFSFKIFLTNNMDRGLAKGGLEAESNAYDITIKPYSMEIKRFAKVSFDVTLKLKKGVNPGAHDITFKLVGRGEEGAGREVVSFCLTTAASLPPPPPPSTTFTSNCNVKPIKTSVPNIDGKLDEECWKETAIFTNFYSNKGGKSKNQTVVLLTYDEKNLYIGAICTEEMIEKIKGDKLNILISPNLDNKFYKIEIDTSGKSRFYKISNGDKEEINSPINSSISVDTDKKAWFMEMSLPLNSLSIDKIKDKEKWRLNIIRFRFKVDGDISFWSGNFSNADTPNGFGEIQFIQ